MKITLKQIKITLEIIVLLLFIFGSFKAGEHNKIKFARAVQSDTESTCAEMIDSLIVNEVTKLSEKNITVEVNKIPLDSFESKYARILSKSQIFGVE